MTSPSGVSCKSSPDCKPSTSCFPRVDQQADVTWLAGSVQTHWASHRSKICAVPCWREEGSTFNNATQSAFLSPGFGASMWIRAVFRPLGGGIMRGASGDVRREETSHIKIEP